MSQRTDDPVVIEHRLLELVYTTDAPITPMALAYFAPCSLEDAEKLLDSLVARARIRLEVGDDGTLTYVFPNRYKLAPREPPQQLVLRREAAPVRSRRQRANPLLAAALSVVVPGAGQLYSGNAFSALIWFLLVTAGYLLIVPGLLLHLFCIVSAAGAAHRTNASLAPLQLEGS